MKEIFIYMDDSGVLHSNDSYIIYGGIVFLSKNDYDEYKNKYLDITSKTRKEKKYSNSSYIFKSKIFNLLNKCITFGLINKNYNIDQDIMNSKKSRGRYRDYSQRIIIKNVIKYLIKHKYIKPLDDIKINIFIDENNMLSNANRKFKNDILSELTKGILNKKYNNFIYPILFGDVTIDLKYIKSHNCVGIQMADFISGHLRNRILEKKSYNISIIKIIP